MNATSKCIAPELEAAARFHGLFSRVAKRLGLTPQHVRQVGRGLRKSRRVSTAINRELNRIRVRTKGKAA